MAYNGIRYLRQILTGVNKKPKNFKTVWHGFRGILKLSGRVNQASLKMSAGFQILSVGLPKLF